MHATYKNLLSISQIREQGHGGLRNSHRKNVPLDGEVCQQQYIMNSECERGRIIILHNKDRLTLKQESVSNSHHTQTKEEQSISREQLLENGRLYRRQKMNNLPFKLPNKISVHQLMNNGIVQENKELIELKMEHVREVNERRTQKIEPVENWEDKANNLPVDNDAN